METLRQKTKKIISNSNINKEELPYPLSEEVRRERKILRLANFYDYYLTNFLFDKYTASEQTFWLGKDNIRFRYSLNIYPPKSVCSKENGIFNDYVIDMANDTYKEWSKLTSGISDFDKNVVYFKYLYPGAEFFSSEQHEGRDVGHPFFMDHKYYPKNYTENNYSNIEEMFDYFVENFDHYMNNIYGFNFTDTIFSNKKEILDDLTEGSNQDINFINIFIFFFFEIFFDLENYIPVEYPLLKGYTAMEDSNHVP